MFGTKSLVAAAVIGLSACTMASAQDTTVERQWELILGGSGGSDKDFDSNSFNANGQLGYYFTEQLQVNVRQTLGFADSDGGSSWVGATRVGVDYHFDMGQDQRFIPFVGAELGYIYGDDVNDTFAAGPEAGVKAYVNDTTFIYGSVLYEFLFDSGDDVDSSLDDGQFVYALGIGFRW